MGSESAANIIAAALEEGGQAQDRPAFLHPDIAAPILTTEEKQELARRLTRFIVIALKAKTMNQAFRLWNWADHQPEGPGAYDEIMVAMNPQWGR